MHNSLGQYESIARTTTLNVDRLQTMLIKGCYSNL